MACSFNSELAIYGTEQAADAYTVIGADAYTGDGIPFIRVSNLNKFGITDNSQQYLSEKLYEDLKSKYQPKKDDILLSKDGTPGIAYFLSENPQKMIISGGILRLVIKNKEYLPEYVTLVLNSIFVQEQIEQKSSGALIKHWLIDEIKNTVISPDGNRYYHSLLSKSLHIKAFRGILNS